MSGGRPARVFVGIGGNIGDRLAILRAAVASLDAGAIDRTWVAAASPIYETRPVGPSTDPFLNAVVELRTTLAPPQLLDGLLSLEAEHGRRREQRWEARTLDLDIVVWLAPHDGVYAPRVVQRPGLTLPHPRAAERDFVLAPLADLLPDARVLDGRSPRALLDALPQTARTVIARRSEPLREQPATG